jgi:hypothetical protein
MTRPGLPTNFQVRPTHHLLGLATQAAIGLLLLGLVLVVAAVVS